MGEGSASEGVTTVTPAETPEKAHSYRRKQHRIRSCLYLLLTHLKMQNQHTYNYNYVEVPLDKLPEELRSHITQAEDFFQKLDEAPTQEAREEIINTHPYNQE